MTGTPLASVAAPPTPPTALEMTRMIATARVIMPRSMVRLSAGRKGFTDAEQAMMFLAGANSIFYGEQLLTTANPEVSKYSSTNTYIYIYVHLDSIALCALKLTFLILLLNFIVFVCIFAYCVFRVWMNE